MKVLHSSDWQIGKVFRFVDSSVMGVLQDARLRAVSRLGELAVAHGVRHVLVAGDVYDMEALSPRSLNQPIERMRAFPTVEWHLLPGNHDHYRPNGLWDRLHRQQLPANVHAHVRPEPHVLDDGAAAILPAPLTHRRTLQDLTAYMDGVALPEGTIRIGLAHGSITDFGAGETGAHNYIAPDRPARAGLAYLALGDWHGRRRIGDRCWYSGTPETDDFGVVDGGHALLVELDGAAAPPAVTGLDVGHYTWATLAETVNSRADVDFLEQKLRELGNDLNRVLVKLTVEGTLSLSDRQYFEDCITDGAAAAFCHLRVDAARLFPRPTAEDLDQIDRGGFIRAAAETLKAKADQGDDLAAEALQRLYVEHMKLQAERR